MDTDWPDAFLAMVPKALTQFIDPGIYWTRVLNSYDDLSQANRHYKDNESFNCKRYLCLFHLTRFITNPFDIYKIFHNW